MFLIQKALSTLKTAAPLSTRSRSTPVTTLGEPVETELAPETYLQELEENDVIFEKELLRDAVYWAIKYRETAAGQELDDFEEGELKAFIEEALSLLEIESVKGSMSRRKAARRDISLKRCIEMTEENSDGENPFMTVAYLNQSNTGKSLIATISRPDLIPGIETEEKTLNVGYVPKSKIQALLDGEQNLVAIQEFTEDEEDGGFAGTLGRNSDAEADQPEFYVSLDEPDIFVGGIYRDRLEEQMEEEPPKYGAGITRMVQASA